MLIDTAKRIASIETLLNNIDKRIAELQTQRAEVVRLDPEYAAYLDAFAQSGTGDPLSLREYYKLIDEMETLVNTKTWSDRTYRRADEIENLLLV